jgi:amino acid adenylation domain-containing protein
VAARSARNWIDVLGDAAAREPDKVAFSYLTDGGTGRLDLTYRELDLRARAVAASLTAGGLTDRRAVLWYPSGLDYLAAFFGCLYGRVVPVPAYPPTPRRLDRVAAILRDCRPAAVLTTSAVRDKLAAGAGTAGLTDQLPRLVATDHVPLHAGDDWRRPAVRPDELAFVQYTSGSTSAPRGVLLTHANLLANSALTHRLFGTSTDTRAVSWLPMYHDMGLIGAILQTVYCGGSCLLLSPSAFAKQPARWLRAISDSHANASGAPNFAYDLCVDRISPEECAGLDLGGWRLAFNGAEPIRPRTLHRFAEAFAGYGFRADAFTPCYGLAEATLMVTCKPLGGSVATVDGASVGAGPVPDGVRVEIVDPATGVPCPPGTEGEIWVCGPSVGVGYWEQVEATERTFHARLPGTTGPTFLRTGDLGRFHDGQLHVTGRHKDLVIVRGRNHHPQDIEQTVERCDPLLRRNGGAAVAVPVDGVEHLIVVHEIARDHDGVDLPGLADRVSAAVAAAHDVRPYAVVLIRAGSLPRTSSGKVQRHRCRERYLAGNLDVVASPAGALPVATAPPVDGADDRARVGRLLRQEVAALGGIPAEEVADDRPLVMIGLDSLAVTALEHRIETTLGVSLSMEEALTRSLAELVELILLRSPRDAATTALAPVARVEPVDHPLSHGQHALWLLHRLVPDTPAHVIAAAARVPAGIDADALARAVGHVTARHEALRTTFPMVDGRPVQRVHPGLAPECRILDATGWDADARAAYRERDAIAPFDIEAGPLFRVSVLRCPDGADEVVVAVHHLIADLWSMEVLLRELDAAYPQAVAGTLPPAGPAPTYLAYTDRQAALLADHAEPLWEHWRAGLRGAPTMLALPVRPVSGTRRLRAAAVPIALDAAATARLAGLARDQRTTPYAVLLAAYQFFLSQWSGQRDVLVGSPAHGRRAADADAIGLYVNMLVLRGRLDPAGTVAELVRTAGVSVRTALAHADLPFATLVERLQPVRDPARSPLVQAVLAVHRPVGERRDSVAGLALGVPGVAGTIGGLPLESLPLPTGGAQFDLVLSLAEVDGRLVGELAYDTGLFTAGAVEPAAAHLTALLDRFADDPDRRLADLPGFTHDRADPGATTDGGTPPRPLRRVDDLFAEHARQAPGRTALVWPDGSMTYGELDAAANRLASRLRSAGVGPEVLVGLFLDRSPELVVAVLAVLKAGGAYVPLDPAYPTDRLAFVLDDTAAPVVVTRRGLRDRLPAHPAAIVEVDAPDPGGEVDVPAMDPELDRLAYVIYTSGSSGRPKGVLVEHRAVANLFAGTSDAFGFGPTDVWTLFHSYAFDFSVWEIWGALAHGGTLVVIPADATLSAPRLWDLVDRYGVTVLNQTPAVFRELTSTAPERLAGLGLRHVIFGGEKLDESHLTTWRRHGNPATRLTNMYGITEITVHATYGPLPGAVAAGGAAPLGVPLPGTELHLLDPRGRPVGAGETGEICLGGAGLARGYLNRPGLTASRFTPHPTRPGERIYRSGDLGTRSGSALRYQGRADDQVKIRGYRIEPGEVAAAVATHPGVRDVFATAFEVRGAPRLVAYVVPADPAVPPPGPDLRRHARQLLPDYLVPSAFVAVPALPLTVNGKVDRAALPRPEELDDAGPAAAAATETERALARLVAELLEVSTVGRRIDLFDLGCHSLLMARLALNIRERFGVDVPLPEMFLEPTVERIAALIDSGTPDAAGAPAIGPVDRSRYVGQRGADGVVRLPPAITAVRLTP